ncbi:MAG: hypothetical protein A2V77_22430 [Anaeromyxobacter sp. RBG_16_69_14]|nr:MAG: hypothetical protein A2V77_22430 [Anaeromyxobacter sp. RBG_16_69_14]
MPVNRFVLVASALVVLGGCSTHSRLDAERQGWAVQRRGLEDQLDRLEERLLADQARVRFWQRMRERHENVSAVACENLGRHAEGIATFQENQRQKRDALAKKNRVATRLGGTADAAR